MRAVQRRVHPESVEASEVLEADGKDDTLEGLGLGGGRLGGSLGELEGYSVARRCRRHAWQVDVVWNDLSTSQLFGDAPLECKLRKDIGWKECSSEDQLASTHESKRMILLSSESMKIFSLRECILSVILSKQ